MGNLVRSHRGRCLRLVAGLVAAVVVLLVWGVSGALADTVIGEQNLVPSMGSADQLGQNVPVFQGDSGGGYVLSASQPEQITSWKFLSGGVATGKHFELAVLAPSDQSGMNWRLIATSAPVAVTTPTGTDAVNGPFPVQISVAAGYRIALMPVDDSNTPIEAGTQGADGIRYFSQPFNGGLGSSQQVASTADNGQVVPIQATIGSGGSPPVNTRAPSISGTARQFETLTGDEGLWQNGVNKFTDVWLRCASDGTSCAVVPGASSTTYMLTKQDVGFTMRFQVTASNSDGDSQPVQSAPTAVVQRGVVTAKLAVIPNQSCTGVATTFDARGSVSPDGIKSYSIKIIDLWAAASEQPNYVGGTYRSPEANVDREAQTLSLPDGVVNPATHHNAQYLIDHYAGPPVVRDRPIIVETFDWNREFFIMSDIPFFARDPVGVDLVVTDYAGHRARAFAVLNFGHTAYHAPLLPPVFGQQTDFPDYRAGCPKATLIAAPSSVVAEHLSFSSGSSHPATTASCQSRTACVGSITVGELGSKRSCDSCATGAARRRSHLLASGFIHIPAHRKRKVTLTLTQLGKRLLHRGASVRVRVTVVTVSPTGRTRTSVYTQVLKR